MHGLHRPPHLKRPVGARSRSPEARDLKMSLSEGTYTKSPGFRAPRSGFLLHSRLRVDWASYAGVNKEQRTLVARCFALPSRSHFPSHPQWCRASCFVWRPPKEPFKSKSSRAKLHSVCQERGVAGALERDLEGLSCCSVFSRAGTCAAVAWQVQWLSCLHTCRSLSATTATSPPRRQPEHGGCTML